MNSFWLFVYGSLSEGMVHYNRIRDLVISSHPGVTKGSLYRLKVGFPAMVFQGQDSIVGQLVEVTGTEVTLFMLDEFFGFNSQNPLKSPYHRENIEVQLNDGSSKMAWAYGLNSAKIPPDAVKIDGITWQDQLRQNPPLTERLTEKQRNYVLKLGASSGRDIVPIDLALYRELMSLELIVDKGRRLALSKLGQELFKHLNH